MYFFKFSFLFSVIAGSSLTFATPTSIQTAAQIPPKKVAVSSANAPMSTANVDSKQYRLEKGHKIAEAKRKAEASAEKKAEAKKIASNTKKIIQQTILSNWQAPAESTGQKSHTRITLTPSGSIQSIVIRDTLNQEFKDSIEKAIRRSAPFDLPDNPDALRESRLIYMSFHSK
ncbi:MULTISPECIES: TonB C-terminal domain-containing protein [unclassified Acinetobacter]|uniref:TonB C-terminal domain-containing protein n=1 Tax=unclassified Acinetobacter TaxID=196816 RepID=UPI0015D3D8CE|nr:MULTISPECIES: TonB C-terminal domain-containing protein [unclassified Acinetobacter]